MKRNLRIHVRPTKRKLSARVRAVRFGEQVKNGLTFPRWFGRNGQLPSLVDMDPDDFAALAARAAREARNHRRRYPLRSNPSNGCA